MTFLISFYSVSAIVKKVFKHLNALTHYDHFGPVLESEQEINNFVKYIIMKSNPVFLKDVWE